MSLHLGQPNEQAVFDTDGDSLFPITLSLFGFWDTIFSYFSNFTTCSFFILLSWFPLISPIFKLWRAPGAQSVDLFFLHLHQWFSRLGGGGWGAGEVCGGVMILPAEAIWTCLEHFCFTAGGGLATCIQSAGDLTVHSTVLHTKGV